MEETRGKLGVELWGSPLLTDPDQAGWFLCEAAHVLDVSLKQCEAALSYPICHAVAAHAREPVRVGKFAVNNAHSAGWRLGWTYLAAWRLSFPRTQDPAKDAREIILAAACIFCRRLQEDAFAGMEQPDEDMLVLGIQQESRACLDALSKPDQPEPATPMLSGRSPYFQRKELAVIFRCSVDRLNAVLKKENVEIESLNRENHCFKDLRQLSPFYQQSYLTYLKEHPRSIRT